MRITVKLGSTLREKVPKFKDGEGIIELTDDRPVTVEDALSALGLRAEEVKLIYRNFRLVSPSAPLRDGDRLALFPPIFIHFSQFYLRREDD